MQFHTLSQLGVLIVPHNVVSAEGAQVARLLLGQPRVDAHRVEPKQCHTIVDYHIGLRTWLVKYICKGDEYISTNACNLHIE